MKRAAIALVALAVLASPCAQAQWEKKKDPAVAQRGSSEPAWSAAAPRARGKPDLAGVWSPDGVPLPEGVLNVEIDLDLPKHFIDVGADLPPGTTLPLQPWAAKVVEERQANQGTDDPLAHCRPTGMPLINAVPLPFKIVQTRDLILILYEENSIFRQIFMNGRRPAPDPEPRFLGYSSGRWEGDELVVDTVGFNDRHWLDESGRPLTEKLRLTERFRRPDAGHLEIRITVDDPGAYTAPIDYTIKATLVPDEDLLEYFCTDNEKDAQHYQR